MLNNLPPDKPFIFGIVAPSDSGKTTLIEKLIPILRNKGLNIGIIKHAHHSFDIDIPGKDSYRLRKAGALQTLVTSKHRWALITENKTPTDEPDLLNAITHMDITQLDIIIVEGFKHEAYPKLILHRSGTNKPLIKDDQSVIAYITDIKSDISTTKTVLNLNNLDEIVCFIEKLRLSSQTKNSQT